MSLSTLLKRNFLWIVYAIFLVLAIIYRSDEQILFSQGPYAVGKPIIWLIYIAFLGYSLYISTKESFVGTLKKIYPFRWARQIGMDLYVSMTLSLALIYLNEKSWMVVLVWFLPVLIYANLAVLPYLALNYDSVLANFI